MEGRALARGAKSLLLFLVRAIVFPLAWLWALAVAKRHEDADPKARTKVMAGIVIGIVAAAGVGYFLYDFQEDARANMYAGMEGRLAQVYGENAYNDQGVNLEASNAQIEVISVNLAAARDRADAALAEGNITAYEEEMELIVEFSLALERAENNKLAAERDRGRLQEEHAFFDSIHGDVVAQDDAAIRDAAERRARAIEHDEDLADALLSAEAALDQARDDVAVAQSEVLRYDLLERGGLPFNQTEADQAQAELEQAEAARDEARQDRDEALAAAQQAGFELPVATDVYDPGNLVKRTDKQLGIKSDAEADMAQVMALLLFPGVIGVFYAPLIIALGSVMANAWEPSDSVGYKKYPGLSLGLFLFLGAFGWPALLFSAWGFWDIEVRSQEGQISL